MAYTLIKRCHGRINETTVVLKKQVPENTLSTWAAAKRV